MGTASCFHCLACWEPELRVHLQVECRGSVRAPPALSTCSRRPCSPWSPSPGRGRPTGESVRLMLTSWPPPAVPLSLPGAAGEVLLGRKGRDS